MSFPDDTVTLYKYSSFLIRENQDGKQFLIMSRKIFLEKQELDLLTESYQITNWVPPNCHQKNSLRQFLIFHGERHRL